MDKNQGLTVFPINSFIAPWTGKVVVYPNGHRLAHVALRVWMGNTGFDLEVSTPTLNDPAYQMIDETWCAATLTKWATELGLEVPYPFHPLA